ncbi:MopE-related protein [Thermodesulfobacteriota bacterium]
MAALFVCMPSSALATDVSGPIDADTNWDVAGSPYVLVGDVTVNAVLTIDAGVEVRANPGTELLVMGGMFVNGEEGNEVLFTSNSGTPAMGDWEGIEFSIAGLDNGISHAVIEYADTGITISSSTPTIENCDIQYNVTGIYIKGILCEPVITGNNIHQNNYGIECYHVIAYPMSPAPVVNYNSFDNIVQDFTLSQLGGGQAYRTMDVTNNWWGTVDPDEINDAIEDFQDHPELAVVNYFPFLDAQDGDPYVPASGTWVQGGITDHAVWSASGSPYLVIGSIIVQAGASLTIEPGTEAWFTENKYLRIQNGELFANGTEGNEILFTSDSVLASPGDWGGIFMRYSDGTLQITHALIEGAGLGISILSCSPTIEHVEIANNNDGVFIEGDPSFPTFTNCNIHDNQLGMSLLYQGLDSESPLVTINYSILDNTGYNLVLNLSGEWYYHASKTIDARYNWWGTTDYVQISDKIVDGADDQSFPIVNYLPILDGPEGDPFVPSGETWLQGGIVGSPTWTAAESPYLVIDDVVVQPEGHLTIEAGTEIRFVQGKRLFVTGEIQVGGMEGNEVLFTSEDPGRSMWDGLVLNSVNDDNIIVYAIVEYATNGIVIEGCSPTVTHCTVRHCSFGIFIDYGAPEISYCSISNNTYGAFVQGDDCAPLFMYNNFFDNQCGVGSNHRSTASGPDPVLNYNDFDNFGSNMEFFREIGISNNHKAIDARYNWWGTLDPDAINTKIIDFSEDAFLPILSYWPFLDGPEGSPPYTPPEGTWVQGGLSGNLEWTAAGNPYTVIGDVIFQDGVLTIGPGTDMIFTDSAVLMSHGKILAEGEEGNEIRFVSNGRGAWAGISLYNAVEDSVISHAEIQGAYTGISINFSSPAITDNEIHQNGTGIFVRGNTSFPEIMENRIQNNNIGIDCFREAEDQDGPLPVVNYNVLADNSVANFVATRDMMNHNFLAVDARFNWWGTIDPDEINDSINDYSEDNTLAIVTYFPFLDAEVDGEPYFPEDVFWVQGGIVEDIVWSLWGKPYIAIGDVVVEPGASLTIEPGVEVLFEPVTGLRSYGTLRIEGAQGEMVRFSSNEAVPAPGDWRGIDFVLTGTECLVQWATIQHAEEGLSFFYDADTTVDHIVSMNNEIGIYAEKNADPIITNSTITQNGYGVDCKFQASQGRSSYPRVNDSDIFGNSVYDYFVHRDEGTHQGETLDAINNWWGTDDSATIASHVWDNSDDSNLPVVGFGPFRTSLANDRDGDDVIDVIDNCPDDNNPGQEDGDSDGWGDACDCGAADPDVNPGADELCGDGIDNDCDGQSENADLDHDGYIAIGCAGADCDDSNHLVNPGADELCGDGIDNDCDGQSENADLDEDSYIAEACGGDDCDDSSTDFYPGADELCDGLDNDCDGLILADEQDADDDGVMGCEGDCDDFEPLTYPGADEVCDQKDNDCDSVLPADEEDVDEDGFALCQGDCDNDPSDDPPVCDTEPQHSTCAANINPSVFEECEDGVDNDCDGDIDGNDLDCVDCTDDDSDGYAIEGGLCGEVDCDDTNPEVNPGHEEVPGNGIDDNCNGQVDEPGTCFIGVTGMM